MQPKPVILTMFIVKSWIVVILIEDWDHETRLYRTCWWFELGKGDQFKKLQQIFFNEYPEVYL